MRVREGFFSNSNAKELESSSSGGKGGFSSTKLSMTFEVKSRQEFVASEKPFHLRTRSPHAHDSMNSPIKFKRNTEMDKKICNGE